MSFYQQPTMITYYPVKPYKCYLDNMDRHPCAVVTNLMKLSFDDDHRQAMSHLGVLQGLSELLHLDQLAHGSLCDDAQCTTLRRYASMTLTNLTFGHGPNKSLLCSLRPLLVVLSQQLASPNDDLRQVRLIKLIRLLTIIE